MTRALRRIVELWSSLIGAWRQRRQIVASSIRMAPEVDRNRRGQVHQVQAQAAHARAASFERESAANELATAAISTRLVIQQAVDRLRN